MSNIFHGAENVFASEAVQEKIRRINIDRYGVDNPMKSKVIQQRASETCTVHYGVPYPMQSEEVRKKYDWKSCAIKCHETMKERGLYGKSKVEDEFYSLLVSEFGSENIERQKLIERWSIDFYVKSIDTYIQFDGVYWHGLDRPLEVIAELKHPRDKVIMSTVKRDKRQNNWFSKSGLCLVRVTDKEFQNSPAQSIMKVRGIDV